MNARDVERWKLIEEEVNKEETEKSYEQVFAELKTNEVGPTEIKSIRAIIIHSIDIRNKYINNFVDGICNERKRIANTKIYRPEDNTVAICLAITSMALYTCKQFWPSNTQFSELLFVGFKKPRM